MLIKASSFHPFRLSATHIAKTTHSRFKGYNMRGSFYISFGYSNAAILSTHVVLHFMSLLYKPLSTLSTGCVIVCINSSLFNIFNPILDYFATSLHAYLSLCFDSYRNENIEKSIMNIAIQEKITDWFDLHTP